MDDGYLKDSSGVKWTDDPRKRWVSGTEGYTNQPFRMPVISQITSDLWIGGVEDNLVVPNIFEHVVSLHPWKGYETKHKLSSHMTFLMEDSPYQPLGFLLPLADLLAGRDGCTLIHCHMGLNRSAVLAALVLRKWGMQPQNAIDFIRKCRSPAALSNSVFEKFVRESVV